MAFSIGGDPQIRNIVTNIEGLKKLALLPSNVA